MPFTTSFSKVPEMQNDPDAIGIIFSLVCYGIFFLLILGVQLACCYVLFKAASTLPPNYQQAKPGQAFFFLIPIFNLVWAFIYPKALSQSFRNFFYAMNQPSDDCGEQTGQTAAILLVCGFIPCVGMFFSIASLIYVIIYLTKIWDCKGRAEQLAVTSGGYQARPPQSGFDPNNPYSP
ncbi:hypothetical protein [Roseimaritima ulvae]|nr:hypothetical protein [Roseimaritima ulvae]